MIDAVTLGISWPAGAEARHMTLQLTLQRGSRCVWASAVMIAAAAALAGSCTSQTNAADVTAREIAEELFAATPETPVDLAGKDLRFLDLSGLDFKGAQMQGADLYGVDLTNASLKGSDLSDTRLDRSTIIRADFSGASLMGATLLRPTVFTNLAVDWADAPRFAGANLTELRVMARLDGADFQGANLTRADFSPFEWRPGQGTISTLPRVGLAGCDFSKAVLKDANFSHTVLTFSRFIGADLRGVNLSGADLSKADLTGADVSGADLSQADLDGAVLTGVQGLDTVKGLAMAVNLDRAIR